MYPFECRTQMPLYIVTVLVLIKFLNNITRLPFSYVFCIPDRLQYFTIQDTITYLLLVVLINRVQLININLLNYHSAIVLTKSFVLVFAEVCRDTSDTDSYMTDEIATMEVLEYEVDSDSSVSENVFSDDSSSGGTDVNCQQSQRAYEIHKALSFHSLHLPLPNYPHTLGLSCCCLWNSASPLWRREIFYAWFYQ